MWFVFWNPINLTTSRFEALYDRDGTLLGRFHAPATVDVTSEPAGAEVEVEIDEQYLGELEVGLEATVSPLTGARERFGRRSILQQLGGDPLDHVERVAMVVAGPVEPAEIVEVLGVDDQRLAIARDKPGIHDGRELIREPGDGVTTLGKSHAR